MNNQSDGIYFQTAEEAIKVLTQEGKKLEKIAKKIWQRYEDSYEPKEYVRTKRSIRAIKLKRVKSLGNNMYGIELTWENDLVYHDSWIHKKGYTSKNQKGHSVMLIGTKWHSEKLERVYRKQIYRHTYWNWNGGGGSYIDAVVKAYENIKDKRINIEVQWSGAFVK